MKKIVVFIAIFLFAGPAWARDFKVDNNSKVLQNIEQVNALKLSAGDRVLFKRGQVFSGSLNLKYSGTKEKPLFIGAYGLGAKPVITGAMPMKDVDWQEKANNIWQTRVKHNDLMNQLASSTNFNLYLRADDGKAQILSTATSTTALKIMVQNESRDRFGLQLDLGDGQIALAKGKNYILKFSVKASSRIRIPSIGIVENNSPWGGLVANNQIVDADQAWQTAYAYFKASATSSKAKINILLGDVPGGTTLELKNISFGEARGAVEDYKLYEIGQVSFGLQQGMKFSASTSLKKPLDFYYDNNQKSLQLHFAQPKKKLSDLRLALTRDLFDIIGQQNIQIKDLDFAYGGAHGVYASKVRNIKVTDCDFRFIGGGYQYGTTRYGNGIELWEGAANVRLGYNRFYQIYDAPISNQGFAGNQINIEYDHNTSRDTGLGVEIWLQGGGVLGPINIHHNLIYGGGNHYAYAQRPDQRVALLELGYSSPGQMATITVSDNIFKESKANLLLLDKTLAGNGRIVFKRNAWGQKEQGAQAAEIGGKKIIFKNFESFLKNDKRFSESIISSKDYVFTGPFNYSIN